MPRNFDEARKAREDKDRSFVIGGQTFVYRPAVAPEAIVGWTEFAGSTDKEQSALRAAQAALAAAEAAMVAGEAGAAEPAELARLSADIAAKTADVAARTADVEANSKTEREWIAVIDETITAILEPEYTEKWEQARDPNLTHPLSLQDLQELMRWLMAEVSGRPTGEPSGSSPQPDTTEIASTAGSSSPVEPASPPST